MIGLFQENGPCHFVNGEDKPSLNKHSWNNDVNMLYVDQPIGVGFSYGNNEVESTETAAPYVWKLLQAFYAKFPEYESRDFGLFTEVRTDSLPYYQSIMIRVGNADTFSVLRRPLRSRIRNLHPATKRRNQVRIRQGREYQPSRPRN